LGTLWKSVFLFFSFVGRRDGGFCPGNSVEIVDIVEIGWCGERAIWTQDGETEVFECVV
jgi:hypothetical protein